MSIHNKAAAFAVHIEATGSAFRVYLQRHTPAGVTFAMHRARRFDDLDRAEFYAGELAETHGGLAVVHH